MRILVALSNWLNGWRWDMDGWLVRARRSSDPEELSSDVGFVEESAIAVRSHNHASQIDATSRVRTRVRDMGWGDD